MCVHFTMHALTASVTLECGFNQKMSLSVKSKFKMIDLNKIALCVWMTFS